MRTDSPHRKTLVFIINSLEGGGAERAMMNILVGLEGHVAGYDVHLVLLDDLPQVQKIPAYVRRHVLSAQGSMVRSVVQLVALLRRLRPAVTVSFLTRANCASVLAARWLDHRSIISERVHTTRHFGNSAAAGLKKLQVRLFYRFADCIVAVSEGVKRDLVENFGLVGARIVAIHNPMPIDALRVYAGNVSAEGEPYIVSVGRLVQNKNFSMLVKAYAQAGITERLVIVGEGAERGSLEALARQLDVAERITFAGYLQNPYAMVAGARYFVSSSNAEGFPNAIVEAMALGRPVIATDCQAGPADVLSPNAVPAPHDLTEGEFGLLVPVERDDILARAMQRMSREPALSRYGPLGAARAASFDAPTICRLYWNEIAALL